MTAKTSAKNIIPVEFPVQGAVVRYQGQDVPVSELSEDALMLFLARTMHALEQLSSAFLDARNTILDWQNEGGPFNPKTTEVKEPAFKPELPLDTYNYAEWQWCEGVESRMLTEMTRSDLEQALLQSQVTLKSLALRWQNVSKLFGAWA